MKHLKPFYKTFAWEFVRTNSAAQAYLNASGETAVTAKEKIKASTKGHRLSIVPDVKYYIEQIRSDQRIGVDEVVSEIADIIRFDPGELFDESGNVKSIFQMSETARKMITAIDIDEIWLGRGKDREQIGVTKKLKFISKLDAIEKAMKHLGAYKEDNNQKRAVNQVAIFQLPANDREVPMIEVVDMVKEYLTEHGVDVDGEPGEGEPGEVVGGRGVQGNLTGAGHLYPDTEDVDFEEDL